MVQCIAFEAVLQRNNAGHLSLESCISGRTSWLGQFILVSPQLCSYADLTDVSLTWEIWVQD